MQATKQQQIMVFFIEEAKEHLDTIEQGLLDLQTTLGDNEQMNELFRAAHSIKGGAAMLGFDSIQRVAHHLEDYFKVLKDNPIKPDRQLEDLFLKGFDALKDLVEELQSPYGLQEEQAQQIVDASLPTFANLRNYLNRLIAGANAAAQSAVPQRSSAEVIALVNAVLKKMLELFKQGDTSVCRKQLTLLCSRMTQLSASPEWCGLLQVAQGAIANPQNAYPTLAPLLIKELKLAGNLVAARRSDEITPSPTLQRLAGIRQSPPAPPVAPQIAPPAPQPIPQAAIAPPQPSAQPSVVSNARSQQISIPLEPRAAARVLLDTFNRAQLIELAEFLMKAIQ